MAARRARQSAASREPFFFNYEDGEEEQTTRRRARRIAADDAIADTESADLVRYGLIPEFVGGFPVTVPLRSLGEDELVRVLMGPRNAAGRQYQRLMRMHGVDLEFTDGALRVIARAALRRETGARVCGRSWRGSLPRRCSRCRMRRTWSRLWWTSRRRGGTRALALRRGEDGGRGRGGRRRGAGLVCRVQGGAGGRNGRRRTRRPDDEPARGYRVTISAKISASLSWVAPTLPGRVRAVVFRASCRRRRPGRHVVVSSRQALTPVRDEQVDPKSRALHDAVSLASVAPFLVCAKAQERVLGHRQNHPTLPAGSALRPPSDHASHRRRLHRRDASSLHRERETWPAVQLMEKPIDSRAANVAVCKTSESSRSAEAHRSVIVLIVSFIA